MQYNEFLTNLFADGRVTVPAFAPLLEGELAAGDDVIAEHERIHRLEMPAQAPQLVASASRWASERFFRACQFAVYRDISPEVISEELSVSYDKTHTPDVHYSVDIIFRYLPDLTRFAASASEEDPLLTHLQRWAVEWPLSSVGMKDVGDIDITGFANHPSLLILYSDRLISTGDHPRLTHDSVRQATKGALGAFPQLSPTTANALLKHDTEETPQ